jgi:putative SOS response-associated peptidase YedK
MPVIMMLVLLLVCRGTAGASATRFARNDDGPLFAFAGIWTEFKGDRGTNEGKSKGAAKETKQRARQRKVG